MLNPLQYPPGTSGVKEHSTSPTIKTQVVLPVRELPHFEGTKREDVITFIRRVDKIAQGTCWTDKEWVLTVADFLGGHAAPLARWIWTGLSVGQNLAKPSNCYPRLYRRLLTSSFSRPIKETGRRSWWSRVWYRVLILPFQYW